MRAAAMILAAVLAAPVAARRPGPDVPAVYDHLIREQSGRWLPTWSWNWLKAQLYVESRMDPNARSPVGAEGLAQLMPDTAAEISRQLKLGMRSSREPEFAVEAAAYYMAQQRAQWRAERSEADRRELAQASYNAGLGSILAAQRRCTAAGARCVTWREVQPYLVQVTGEANARQTTDYVDRIAAVYDHLEGL